MRSAGTVFFFVLLVILLTIVSVQYGPGRLPGDIVIDTGDFYFYLPIATAVLVTVVLGIVSWLFRR